MRKTLLLVIALLLAFRTPASALDRAHYRELQRNAAKLAQQKDWAGFKQALIEIGHELPGETPRHMLMMASVEAHLGKKSEAFAWLLRYTATGLNYDMQHDDDLAPLARYPAFGAISGQMGYNAMPFEKAELVCSLPLADMMPEDLTYSSPKNSFFLSSVQHHGVFRVTVPIRGGKGCTVSELPLSAEAKRWPTLAVSWDAHRSLLWLSTSAMPGFGGFPKEDSGKAALCAVDPDSGRVLRRLDLASNSPAVLGDMSIGPDGTLYITDSIGGGVYRVAPGPLVSARLEKIADGLLFPQTPVPSGDGKRLFVADYAVGVAVIDLSRGGPAKVTYLKHRETIAMTGLDGLSLSGNTLAGVENGTEPVRVVRYKLNPTQIEVISVEVIDQSTSRLGAPTHVIESDGWFYVIANVGWDKVGDNGKLRKGQRFTPPVLLRFRAN
jgi:hypothetical protein